MKNINQHFINGEFVDSHGTETQEIFNPATGQIIGKVILGDEEDTRKAIEAAKQAFESYGKSSLETRADYLQRLEDAVTHDMERLIDITVEEYGGPLGFSKFIIEDAINFFRQAKDLLNEIPFTKTIGQATVTLEPVGVTGIITPWNGGIWSMCMKTASALAAGCTVVIKPSEMSTLEAQALAESFHRANLPAGIINVVNGRGDVVGAELTRNPDVAKITFTGSTTVGKLIARDGAATMKRLTLELGGKSPMIILDDADVAESVQFALSAGFMNSGQACIAGTRVLVPESRLEEFKEALKQGVQSIKVGNPSDVDTMIGPMISVMQYERVQGYIRKGIEEGAELLIGGEGHPEGLEAGNFVRPTIFVNVSNDMTIAREEIFGPVLSVITYRTEEEAVQISNDTPYGLHAYVATKDLQRGRNVANQIRAGRVMINEFFFESGAPFGGFKQSGVGREFGVYGVEAFLEPKSVMSK
jgi:aldehyde dehydrogenase (NAD+)